MKSHRRLHHVFSFSPSHLAALQQLGILPRHFEVIAQAPYPASVEMLRELKAAAKKAYRRLALELHPDRTGGDFEKTERFKAVCEAFRILVALEVVPPPPPPVSVVHYVVRGPEPPPSIPRPRRPPNPMHVVFMRPF